MITIIILYLGIERKMQKLLQVTFLRCENVEEEKKIRMNAKGKAYSTINSDRSKIKINHAKP